MFRFSRWAVCFVDNRRVDSRRRRIRHHVHGVHPELRSVTVSDGLALWYVFRFLRRLFQLGGFLGDVQTLRCALFTAFRTGCWRVVRSATTRTTPRRFRVEVGQRLGIDFQGGREHRIEFFSSRWSAVQTGAVATSSVTGSGTPHSDVRRGCVRRRYTRSLTSRRGHPVIVLFIYLVPSRISQSRTWQIEGNAKP